MKAFLIFEQAAIRVTMQKHIVISGIDPGIVFGMARHFFLSGHRGGNIETSKRKESSKFLCALYVRCNLTGKVSFHIPISNQYNRT